MRIAMAQTNPIVGDIAGNTQAIVKTLQDARRQQADLVVFSELAIIGYPPRDLLLKPSVLQQMAEAVNMIAAASENITCLLGCVIPNTATAGRPLYNAAVLLRNSTVLATAYKSLLPTYDVFDESRYFEPGPSVQIVSLDGYPLGLSICEDLWNDEQIFGRQLYHTNPVEQLAHGGAQILFNLSASPFVAGKNEFRRKLISHQAGRWKIPIVYVNQVGANDELIFDGNSMAFDAQGNLLAQAADFAPDLVVFDLDRKAPATKVGTPPATIAREGIESIHAALVLGLRDYARKCGFQSAVLGLSGGIDSAVVAALAAEALGPQHVLGVSLPSRFSSDHSRDDAATLASALGIQYQVLPIEDVHRAMEHTLANCFAHTQTGLAEENLQARIRGNLLMALSNKFGHLLLTTGNKSEIATGYCTLYGDMCGGLAVISDVPKTMVYPLARHINALGSRTGRPALIPESTLTKPPSAELRPNQKDQDTLPPYEILDAILQRYIEEEQSVWDIIDAGFDQTTVLRVARMVDLNEYKRKQMPPGLKVTSRAFGMGRRMPIAQRYDPARLSIRP
ncbi:MAG: NAD+ synthase [Phycisphaerae bacterium]|nr:NAD+ synthase [Phycisphaerae bacterium]